MPRMDDPKSYCISRCEDQLRRQAPLGNNCLRRRGRRLSEWERGPYGGPAKYDLTKTVRTGRTGSLSTEEHRPAAKTPPRASRSEETTGALQGTQDRPYKVRHDKNL